MRLLAREAGLSLATPYNLFGSKAQVLFALLDQSMDELDQLAASLPVGEPIERAYELVTLAVDLFGADERLYRGLMQALKSATDSTPPPGAVERCVSLAESWVIEAMEQGLLLDTARADLIARHVFLGYLGALDQWTFRQIDTDGFRVQSLYGLTVTLLAFAVNDELRARLQQKLAELEGELAKRLETAEGRRPDRKAS